MILTPGEMTQKLPNGSVQDRAFVTVRFDAGHSLVLLRMAPEDVTNMDKSVDPAVRACPSYWAGYVGEPYFLVHPRPDRPYELEWIEA